MKIASMLIAAALGGCAGTVHYRGTVAVQDPNYQRHHRGNIVIRDHRH